MEFLMVVVFGLVLWLLVVQSRVAQLEERLRNLKESRIERADETLPAGSADQPMANIPTESNSQAPMRASVPEPVPAGVRDSQRTRLRLSSGQLFAVVGGLFVLAGVITFITMAVSRGWISELLQVLIGYGFGLVVASAAMLVGARRGQNAATLIGAGLGGAIVQLVNVAGVQRYEVISESAGLVIALLAGAGVVACAARFSSQLLAGFGIVTALGAPILLDLSPTGATLALVAVALVGAVGVVATRGWPWLGVATLAITFPQLWMWMEQQTGHEIRATAVIIVWWSLLVAAAIAYDVRKAQGKLRTSSAALVFSAGSAASTLLLVPDAHDVSARSLLVLGLIHLVPAVMLALLRGARSQMVAIWIGVVGAGVLAIAVGQAFDAPVRVAFWTIQAVALWVVYCRWQDLRAGVSAAVMGLVAFLAGLVVAPPLDVLTASVDVRTSLLAVTPLMFGGIAAAALSVRTVASNAAHHAEQGDAVLTRNHAMVRSGYWVGAAVVASAAPWLALHLGTELVEPSSWGRLLSLGCVVAAALVLQWFRSDVVTSIVVAVEFGILGVVALAELMSPLYLANGSEDAFGTAMAAGLLLALLRTALATSVQPGTAYATLFRACARWSFGAVCLLASSILLVTALSPTPGVGSAPQNGQLALSTYWGVVGLAAIMWGLARGVTVAHRAGASLLAVAGAKVLLLDTQQLEAAYRTGVFIGVGLIMLIGGFAYLRNASESAGE